MSFDLTPPDHINEDLPEEAIEVPYQRLSAEALQGVIEEFISREGTDYGDYDYSFNDKKNHVLRQLQQNTAIILFDPSSQTCQIELKRNFFTNHIS